MASTSSLKPITLYSHAIGPNPWKVALFLEELNLPYTTEYKDFSELKGTSYDATINPNGRVPAIVDPNTSTTLWESGAILEYLIEVYDKSGSLHYAQTPERWFTQQFLHFQVSGQGPYFGQAAWFTLFHADKNIESAKTRYYDEIKRVTKVLDGVLAKNGGKALVGDKVTYADLSFVPWYWLTAFIDQSGKMDEGLHAENPAWSTWIKALNERPAVKKVFEARAAKLKG